MVRPPCCCDKLNLKRALWTAEEDAKILAHVSKHGTGNWTTVPRKAGLKRCGKSCRLRWTNYLRPDLKHDSFTPEEEEWIIRLHAAIGSRWSIIAQQLPGRTDNDVKNYWNTKLRKKLTEMGIDPITHKPFSQILADYGSIGGFPKATETQIGSLNGNLKNAFKQRAEQPSVPPQGLEDFKSHQTKEAETPNKSEPGANDHSMELLSELQAITVVKEVSNCTKQRPGFKGTSAPSPRPSSSSSSTCSTAAQAMSPMAFSWEDFLLEDAFPPQEQGQAPTSMAEQNNDLNCIIWEDQKGFNGAAKQDCNVHESGFQASSSNSTFVDAILDRESELFVEFPDIFEEPFYC